MNKQHDISIIGVDLGGTKILASRIRNAQIVDSYKSGVPSNGSEQEVISALCDTIDMVIDTEVQAIGLGVPSVVDTEKGIVYDVQNIPSWKEVHLKDILEKKYNLPVYLNNDANCFALGEKYFGNGQNYKNMIGLIIGTGMAGGIIIDDKLYNGINCGAGEFGMIPYLDKYFEYYACGQFFNNVYGVPGEVVFDRAINGDQEAIKMFDELGFHLGNAINMILYAFDPEIIILGGSVSKAYNLFKKSMWTQIKKLVYGSIADKIKIEVSTRSDIAVLGAAALCYNVHTASDITEIKNKEAVRN